MLLKNVSSVPLERLHTWKSINICIFCSKNTLLKLTDCFHRINEYFIIIFLKNSFLFYFSYRNWFVWNISTLKMRTFAFLIPGHNGKPHWHTDTGLKVNRCMVKTVSISTDLCLECAKSTLLSAILFQVGCFDSTNFRTVPLSLMYIYANNVYT